MKGLLALLAICLALASACDENTSEREDSTPVQPTNGELTVRAFEWGFEPSRIDLPLGEEIHLTLRNDGEILHNLRIEDLEAAVIESNEENELFVEADEGEEAELMFLPEEEGEFTYLCTVPGHRDLGMTGVMTVTRPR